MWYVWIALSLLSVSFAAVDGDPPPAPINIADTAGHVPEPSETHNQDNPDKKDQIVKEQIDMKTNEEHVSKVHSPAPRTLDRTAGELAWGAWLQSPESRDPAAPPRRITTKSLFVTPYICPNGQRLEREGCVQLVTVNREDHEKYILEQLNAVFAPPASSAPDNGEGDAGYVVYDYDEPATAVDAAAGPLQLTIPLGLDPPSPLVAAASQNQPSLVPINIDKKGEDQKIDLQDAKLEAELEKLKQEMDRKTNANLHYAKNETHNYDKVGPPPNINFNNYPTMTIDKPKRDNAKENITATNDDKDLGQKEAIFGNVSQDTAQYATITQTEISHIDEKKESSKPIQTEQQITHENFETSTETHKVINSEDDKPKSQVIEPVVCPDSTTADKLMTTTQTPHNLKEDEKPAKLHPEIDYSDLGEAVKIISRYAEVTTDDTFKNEQKKYLDNNDNPLGTRTKLQHRRKLKPSELIPPPPQDRYFNRFYPVHESIYDDRVPSHIIYPKMNLNQNQNVDYFRYPGQNQHYGVPPHPPNYPFRHVQDYWARPEQYLGPYAHENPRRHHHSYTARALPARHVRRPDSAYPVSPAPARDLYSLLGLRHWFSSDGTAKR